MFHIIIILYHSGSSNCWQYVSIDDCLWGWIQACKVTKLKHGNLWSINCYLIVEDGTLKTANVFLHRQLSIVFLGMITISYSLIILVLLWCCPNQPWWPTRSLTLGIYNYPIKELPCFLAVTLFRYQSLEWKGPLPPVGTSSESWLVRVS